MEDGPGTDARLRELGLGAMESVGFQGLVGPAGMPKEVVDRLAAELAKVLAFAQSWPGKLAAMACKAAGWARCTAGRRPPVAKSACRVCALW